MNRFRDWLKCFSPAVPWLVTAFLIVAVLLILLSALRPKAHAQFGGVQQPIFGMQSVASSWNPNSVEGLAYWWNSIDIPDGTFTTWTDRISGLVMTATNGTPFKDTNGVLFDGNVIFTNSTISLNSNYTRAWFGKVWGTTIGYAPMGKWGDHVDAITPWYLYNSNSFVVSHWIAWNGSTADLNTYPKVPYGSFLSLLSVSSNNVTYTWTNGVASLDGGYSTTNTVSQLGRYVGSDNIKGRISELLIYTNALNWASYISNFYYYTTNTWTRQLEYPFVTNQTIAAYQNNYTFRLGCVFKVWRPITVTQLGRLVNSGNSGAHTLYITQGAVTLTSATLLTSGLATNQFHYTNCTPIVLSPNVEYYLESSETNGGDSWADYTSSWYVPAWSGSIIAAAFNETTDPAKTLTMYVGVNFKYQE